MWAEARDRRKQVDLELAGNSGRKSTCLGRRPLHALCHIGRIKMVHLRALKYLIGKHKILFSIAAIGIISVLAGLLVFARSNKPAQAAPRPLEVEVISVQPTNVPIYSEWIGTTDGMVNAEIKAQVTGYLLRQDYKEGSFVKRGQLLFEIDPRPFQAALDQANGQVAQSQGQLEQAISQVTQAEAQEAQANSQLSQSQAQLTQAEANQVKTQLDAPTTVPTPSSPPVVRSECSKRRTTPSAPL